MTGAKDLSPDALAREAATWFARMRGPDSALRSGDFNVWLAQDPAHRAAYNRAGETFALGKFLAEEPAPAPEARPRRRLAYASGIACLLAGGVWFASQHESRVPPNVQASSPSAIRMLATEPGEIRVARLEDGSTARLASDSRLSVQFGTARRVLTLLQGSARFDVHHESRPFIVMAGGGSVTARGTMFDVRLMRPGRVEVRLIRGVVDVQLPSHQSGATAPVRRLIAGESIAYVMPPVSSPTPPPTQFARSGVPTVTDDATARDLVSVPVRSLIADANRSTARPIRLADDGLGEQRVSGRLRVDDTDRLARHLSTLFGWSIDERDPRVIVLKR